MNKNEYKNKQLKITISPTGYTLWATNSIVNNFEKYEVVVENLATLDEVMKHIPKGHYLDLYLTKSQPSDGRYRG